MKPRKLRTNLLFKQVRVEVNKKYRREAKLLFTVIYGIFNFMTSWNRLNFRAWGIEWKMIISSTVQLISELSWPGLYSKFLHVLVLKQIKRYDLEFSTQHRYRLQNCRTKFWLGYLRSFELIAHLRQTSFCHFSYSFTYTIANHCFLNQQRFDFLKNFYVV